ncbi:MAG: ATP-binding protein [Deltaproteobacteria bacterium]|nr:ATP-binding protein [Deltaproteobacteria bacterium]
MARYKLLKLEIKGFRRFSASRSFEFHDATGRPLDYVVLAGPNGSGKTTVLEAILLALGREDLIVRDLAAADRTTAAPVRLEQGAELRAVVRDLERALVYSLHRRAGMPGPRCTGSADTGIPMPEVVEAATIGVQVEYLSSRRLPARVGAIEDAVRGRPADDTEANRLWRFKQRVRQQQGRRVPGYVGPEPLDQLWMAKLNDFWKVFRADGTHLTMTLVDPGDLDASEWDLFLYKGARRICSVDALSSGELEILSMVVPFITEAFDGLLLIDEPELHLHPQWQGRVMRALRRVVPHAQLIVATHADDPWDDAMSWERILLVEPGDPRFQQADESAR